MRKFKTVSSCLFAVAAAAAVIVSSLHAPQFARAQVKRIASVRGLAETEIAALVDRFTEGRLLGIVGEPRVNVLRLNLALDELSS